MNEFLKLATDILSTLMPESDWATVLILFGLLFFILILVGRFKLEWIGHGIRHILRWLRCKCRDKHLFIPDDLTWLDINTGRRRGVFRCSVCGTRLELH